MDLVTVQSINRLLCGVNVTSTTAVSQSVASSSSDFLPDDGEKPNQPKRFLFLKKNIIMVGFS